MKKIYIILIPLIINCLASSEALAGIFLQNFYGKPIEYREQPASAADKFQQKIAHSAHIELSPKPRYLSIRTVGGTWSDISYLFNQISKERPFHKNADTIIMINHSYGIYGWNITIEWVAPNTIQEIPQEIWETQEKQTQPIAEKIELPLSEVSQQEEKEEEKQEALMKLKGADDRLEAIKGDALGPEYAQQVTEICKANYTQAEKLGKINLCSNLKRNLINPIYKIAPKAKKQGLLPSTLSTTIDEIRATIRRLYDALLRYKNRGEAS